MYSKYSKYSKQSGPKGKSNLTQKGSHPKKTPVQQLQSALGNRRLVQLRRSVQRQAVGAPAWLQQDIGVTSSMLDKGEQEEREMEAAENISVPSGGESLPDGVQQTASEQLGVDASNVKVQHGADDVCGQMGAHAFATENEDGSHTIALSSGVDLQSQDGQFTLWHELSHVGQQQRGETNELDGLGGNENARESLEQKADEDANRILS